MLALAERMLPWHEALTRCVRTLLLRTRAISTAISKIQPVNVALGGLEGYMLM